MFVYFFLAGCPNLKNLFVFNSNERFSSFVSHKKKKKKRDNNSCVTFFSGYCFCVFTEANGFVGRQQQHHRIHRCSSDNNPWWLHCVLERRDFNHLHITDILCLVDLVVSDIHRRGKRRGERLLK